MTRLSPTRTLPHARLWAIASIVALFVLGLAAERAAAAPRCHGKKATIVSNARTIVGTKAPNVIVAGGGDNTIDGEGGNDTICAGAGDDTIHGGRGKDSVYGEGGEDTIFDERGSDRSNGGGGADLVLGESGNDRIDGGAGDGDRVNGGPGDDSVEGGSGDFDVLNGGPGNDKIDGGPGSHDIASYAGTGGAVTVDLQTQTVRGAESERLHGIEDAVGGSGADTLIGDPGTANRLDGGPGSDRLDPAGSGDEAFGGPGSDQCNDGFAAETSCGESQGMGATAVELYASIDGTTSLIVTGSEGADAAVVSYSGNVYTVRGEPGGAPVVLGDPTSTACSENQPADSVSCQGHVASILASLGAGNDSLAVADSVPSSISSIVDGGKGADTISGGKGDDVLYGGEDHDPDSLAGGGGDDVLYGVNIFHPRKDSGAATMSGGAGNDLLIGGQPCDGDTFDGGPGSNDSASFARVHNSGTFVKATIGGAVLDPNVSGCQAGHIDGSVEKIEGSPGPDLLIGDNSSNVLLGRGGNDEIKGRGGNDTCIGGGGHDRAASCEQIASVP
ncbi:MAG TPA: calcium-binding protein [Solirubrobacterales bacterium]|nr:calcium-binding protein [Solirubrobacterales bacterium]